MRSIRPRAAATLLVLFCSTWVYAQQLQPTDAVPKIGAVPNTGAVPNVVRFSGSFRPANGMPAQPVESVTLSVYRDQIGGNALWHETQNVPVDGEGKYSLLMGATQNGGMPMELLSSGEPRWVGAQFNRPGEAEQPRSLLASVPYALKASDAETLGGRPASAYLLAEAPAGIGAAASIGATVNTSGATTSTTSTTALKPRATTGTTNYIGVFTDPTDIGNSVMYQLHGNIGIGTTNPITSLDARTYPFSQIGMAQTVDYLTFFSSDCCGPAIYWNPAKDMRFGRGGSSLYNPYGFVEQMRIQSSTGNVGIGTMAPASKLDVAGSINAAANITAASVSAGSISTGSANVKGALSVGSLNTGNITSTGNVSATGTLGSGGDISLNGNVVNGGQIIYQQPYQSPTNTALGVGSYGGGYNGGTNNTASGYGAMSGIGGGSRNAPAIRPIPRVQGSGNNPHLDFGSDPTGSNNTAHGSLALTSISTGWNNTALGAYALQNNTTGSWNTALGAYAMLDNLSGTLNTASGDAALYSNTTGMYNTASGAYALSTNTIGSRNTGVGYDALGNNTGENNAAFGFVALEQNTTGLENTAIGSEALDGNTTGSANIAIGFLASNSVSGGNSNNIHIGSLGAPGDNGVIRIGGYPKSQISFFASGVRGVTTANNDAIPVMVDSAGQLGTTSSSRRFKEDIADMGSASRDLMRLRPVTFRYQRPFADGSKPIQYGLIAEEVAEVYPDLVAHSADGQIETVKYQVLDSMLLNEAQRQQTEIRGLMQRVDEQHKQINEQRQQIDEERQHNHSLEDRLSRLEAVLASAYGNSKISNSR